MKSILSEILNNEVEQLKKEGYKPKKGQQFRTVAQEIACSLKRKHLKLNNIAGQKWSYFKLKILIGLCNLDSSIILVFHYPY